MPKSGLNARAPNIDLHQWREVRLVGVKCKEDNSYMNTTICVVMLPLHDLDSILLGTTKYNSVFEPSSTSSWTPISRLTPHKLLYVQFATNCECRPLKSVRLSVLCNANMLTQCAH